MATTNQNFTSALAAVRAVAGCRVGIVGSREFAPLSLVCELVASLPSGVCVVSGAARGVDSVAASSARKCGLNVVEFAADWSRGRSAGMERNSDIIKNAHVVIAFWDGSSKGTAHSIQLAHRSGVPCFIVHSLANTHAPEQLSLF